MNEQSPPPPSPPVGDKPTATLPFEEPGRAFGAGLLETIKLFILDPDQAFRRMPLRSDILRPLIYAVIVGWVGTAVAYLWGLMFQASILGMLGGLGDAEQVIPPILLGVTAGVLGLVLAPVIILIQVFIYTVVIHLCLMLVGGERNGFATTLRVLCYSNTAQLAQGIPFAGGLIATLWGIVLCVLGLMRSHDTTAG
ncbi:MAG TPA: YIP1 family protein, partial [Candidatus Polarisedimenticolaceae bacterium]|nr:YIP1 family protein [Candidatus Polarisedimenticolaceae bacterium]